MTVSSTTTKVSYSGNGSTTVFAYTFKIFADADLTVIVRTDSTGAEVTKTLTTHYTVSGAGNTNGGNVTFGTAPASGETVVIKRNLALTQSTDYTPNDPFPAASHEDALDRQMFVAQQQEERFARALVFPETDTASTTIPSSVARADKFLGFDSSGNVAALSSTGTTPGAVGTGELEDGSVITAKLADNSVISAKIVDGTIATADIADDAIIAAKVANDAVVTAKIADNAVNNAKMADDSVGANELIDNSVGAAAINIVGNGSSGQAIVSDADGSFSYKTLANQAFQGTIGTLVGSGLTERTSVNITPTSTSAKILILASMFDNANSTDVDIEIQRDSTVLTGSLRQASFREINASGGNLSRLNSLATFWLDEPNTTSQINYKLMSDVACDNANIIAIEISS
jgi:hypothetical protein